MKVSAVKHPSGMPVHTHAASEVTAPGSDMQVLFNDGGALAGDAGLTWDKTNNRLNVNESGFVGPNIAVRGSGSSYAALYAQTSAGISSFSVGEDGSGHAFILFGDADDADNKIKFILVGTTMSFQVPGGLAVLGDYDGFGNGTLLQIDDANQVVTSNVPVEVPDDAYGSGWNGSVEVPTKNAMYDKIESLSGGSGLTHPQVLARGLGA